MHRIVEVPERLLARLDLLGEREVEEVIVVESAERAAERVEPVQEDPAEQQDRDDARRRSGAKAAQRRAGRASIEPVEPAAASITYSGRRRDWSSDRHTYSPTMAMADRTTPQRPRDRPEQNDDRSLQAFEPHQANDHGGQTDHHQRRAGEPAGLDGRVGERGDRVDDQLDLPRDGPPRAAGGARLLVVLDVVLAEPEPRDQREHAHVLLVAAPERVDHHAIDEEEVGAARRHLRHADDVSHDPVVERRKPGVRLIARPFAPRRPDDLRAGAPLLRAAAPSVSGGSCRSDAIMTAASPRT